MNGTGRGMRDQSNESFRKMRGRQRESVRG